MSKQLTSEQAQLLTKLLEELNKNSGGEKTVQAANVPIGNAPTVGAQQLIPDLISGLNTLPLLLTNLVTLPLSGISTVLVGQLLPGLTSLLSSLGGVLGVSSLTGQIPPGLVNIIKEQVPVGSPAAPQSTKQ
ncbi:hypothetical protein [Risungbinella massiliensis]|uniref:hypothetical protein n=1 Tax=Risungbinella massiliensis TaxID=1329796 RepID=UPI0005CC80B5|nr:hypothetical protein [Risungbinella massiliensis]